VADAKATYSVTLEDGVSKTADQAAASLERMKNQIRDDTQALQQMKAAMGRLKGSSSEVLAEKKKLEAQIKATEQSLAKAQAGFLKAGGSLKDLGQKSKDSGKSLSEALAKAEGPAGSAAKRLSEVWKTMEGGGAEAAAMAIGGISILVAALAALVIVGAGAALVMADAARSNRIYMQAVAGSAAGGEKLYESVKRVADQVPMAQAEVQALAVGLSDLGLTGGTLERALRGVATSSSIMGQGAASALQSIIDRAVHMKRFQITANQLQNDLKGTGVSIEDVAKALADRSGKPVAAALAALKAGSVDVAAGVAALDQAVQNKLGGAAAAKMKSFSAQAQRAKDLLGRLFEGLKIERLLDGLEQVVGLLDESSATGSALKSLMEDVMTPLSDWIGGSGLAVKRFFQGLVIGALLVEIGILKLRNAFRDVFGKDVHVNVNLLKVAVYAGAAAVFLMAGGLAVMAVGFALVLAPIFVLIGAIYGIVKAVEALGPPLKKALDGFVATFKKSGGNWMAGLAEGISGNVHVVEGAVTDGADAVIAALKEKTEEHSPSRVFARRSLNWMRGLVQGVNEGAPEVERAVLSVVPMAAPASSSGQAPGRGSVTMTNHWYLQLPPGTTQQQADSLTGQVKRVIVELLTEAGLDPVTT